MRLNHLRGSISHANRQHSWLHIVETGHQVERLRINDQRQIQNQTPFDRDDFDSSPDPASHFVKRKQGNWSTAVRYVAQTSAKSHGPKVWRLAPVSVSHQADDVIVCRAASGLGGRIKSCTKFIGAWRNNNEAWRVHTTLSGFWRHLRSARDYIVALPLHGRRSARRCSR